MRVIFVFYLVGFLAFAATEVVALDYGQRKLDIPSREQSIIVTDEGFYPKSISIFEGELVKFYVTSTTNLSSCMMIPKKDLYLSATKGQISEGEVLFERAGVVKFFCPTGKIKGHITVLPRKRKVERRVASEKNIIKVWRPKELPDNW